ncbi:unnamed protein product [Meganyctiphanes norvegica]|uniref:Ion transport domain-containing protein n=1 Tax=Meganyctiphanes norvegica TaxID=48144 RepID=A0AAV2QFA2_MEGNR
MPENNRVNTMEAGVRLITHSNGSSEAVPVENLPTELLTKLQGGSNDVLLAEQLAHLLPQDDHSSDLNYMFPHKSVDGTLLHLATRRNLPKVAKLLIDKGANPDCRDTRGDRYCPIHYAAEMGYHSLMEILLQGGANPNSTESGNRHSSLHLLVESEQRLSDSKDFEKCLDLLLKHNQMNVDILNKDKETALYLAVERDWEYMVKLLVLKGADLDYKVRNNLSLKDYIDSKFTVLLESIEADNELSNIRNKNISEKIQHFHNELKDNLRMQNIKKFSDILNEIEMVKGKTGLLLVLDSEEDQGKTLLQYACDNGYTEFVDVLINRGVDPLKKDIANHYTPLLYAAGKGYHKILKKLISKMQAEKQLNKGLSQKDKRGETVLHKVVKQEYPRNDASYMHCLKALLKLKPNLNIDATDESGNTALHYAALLDDQTYARLLLINGANLGIRNKNKKLTITNIQASVLKDGLDHCIELPKSNMKGSVSVQDFEVRFNYSQLIGSRESETECIKFLSSSETHCHLLCHPIINTFLSLKWQRIQKYYIFNFSFYVLYLAFLTSYIFLFHDKINGLTSSSFSSENNNGTLDAEISMSEAEHSDLKLTLQILISLMTFLLGIKEGVQFTLSSYSYITSFKNILELTLVTMTFVLLFAKFTPLVQQALSAWLILLAWINFILILGCHPKLAIYITMFKRVSHNFIKFIILFSCMILAFSFSFYLVFQFDENFTSVPQTFFRTFVMTTGELEYTSLPFDTFPFASHTLFFLFVLFILLVLMNFITGLAVSDIHMIQQEAEIYSYRNQVELISHLESQSAAWLCASNPVKKFLNTTLMFPSCLKTERVQMFPNRSAKKRYKVLQYIRGCLGLIPTDQHHVQCTCKHSHRFCLEQSQVDSALTIVLAEKDTSERMTHLEDHVSEIMTQIDEKMHTVDKRVEDLADLLKEVHGHVMNIKKT